MNRSRIVDAGPLVAYIDKSEPLHKWAKSEFANAEGTLITCEAVLTEVCFFLSKVSSGIESLMQFLERAPVLTVPIFEARRSQIKKLMATYHNVPMSFADACLVQLSELYPDTPILTIDSDFLIYRRNRDEHLPVILPPSKRKHRS